MLKLQDKEWAKSKIKHKKQKSSNLFLYYTKLNINNRMGMCEPIYSTIMLENLKPIQTLASNICLQHKGILQKTEKNYKDKACNYIIALQEVFAESYIWIYASI